MSRGTPLFIVEPNAFTAAFQRQTISSYGSHGFTCDAEPSERETCRMRLYEASTSVDIIGTLITYYGKVRGHDGKCLVGEVGSRDDENQ